MLMVKSGGLHQNHGAATWNLGTIFAYACRRRKTKKTSVEVIDPRTFRVHTDFPTYCSVGLLIISITCQT
jgi:hypothetical protein